MAFVRGYQPSGRVELVSKEEALPLIDEIYDAAMRPGGVERNRALRDHSFAAVGEDKDRPWMYAIHRDAAGDADAYAVYWMKHDWPRSVPTGTITVKVHGVHPIRQRGYLAFLFDIDLVATVEAWNRPADEPLLQLVREPRRLHFSVNDGLWVRLLDVGAALEARTYRPTVGSSSRSKIGSAPTPAAGTSWSSREARCAAGGPRRTRISWGRSTPRGDVPRRGPGFRQLCGGQVESACWVRSRGRTRCSGLRPLRGASSTFDRTGSSDACRTC